MNDTCSTTLYSCDSEFSEKQDSGCQSSDVPLVTPLEKDPFIMFRCRMFCGKLSRVPVTSARYAGLFCAGADRFRRLSLRHGLCFRPEPSWKEYRLGRRIPQYPVV